MTADADVVVIGAGIAGVSTAFHLSSRHDVHRVVIVDPRPPLTLTSDKSTECYRNWWPNASMVGLMNRSAVDLPLELQADPMEAEYYEALHDCDAQLVAVCTYSDSHAEYALAAVTAGAHVFVE